MIWKLLFQSLAPPLCHPGGLLKLIFYINVASAHQLTTSEKYPPQRLMGWKFLRENWGNVAWLVGSCGDSPEKKELEEAAGKLLKLGLKARRRNCFLICLWHGFRTTPKNLGVWRFKLAMWEVGGIEIERTRARLGLGNWRKIEFSGKTLRTRKFSKGKFFRAGTHRILTHSGFRIYSRFGWPTLCVRSYSGSKWGHGPKNGLVTKNKRCCKKLTLFLVWSLGNE